MVVLFLFTRALKLRARNPPHMPTSSTAHRRLARAQRAARARLAAKCQAAKARATKKLAREGVPGDGFPRIFMRFHELLAAWGFFWATGKSSRLWDARDKRARTDPPGLACFFQLAAFGSRSQLIECAQNQTHDHEPDCCCSTVMYLVLETLNPKP